VSLGEKEFAISEKTSSPGRRRWPFQEGKAKKNTNCFVLPSEPAVCVAYLCVWRITENEKCLLKKKMKKSEKLTRD
jgi:hypothetical protein